MADELMMLLRHAYSIREKHPSILSNKPFISNLNVHKNGTTVYIKCQILTYLRRNFSVDQVFIDPMPGQLS